jgi:hypothetical protein
MGDVSTRNEMMKFGMEMMFRMAGGGGATPASEGKTDPAKASAG